MKSKKAAAKPSPAAPARTWPGPGVYTDFHRHTCLEVRREDLKSYYIPLEILGLELRSMLIDEFETAYRPLTDYPAEKAAKLYAGYAADLGGTLEAMQALASLTTITPQEIEMATAKKTANASPDAPKPAKKAATKKAPAPAVEKKAKALAPAAAQKKELGAPRESAAQMFKDLIMKGGKTDDQIFAAVKEKFSLDDNKRSYVGWYRNDLTKKGMNPPTAKA